MKNDNARVDARLLVETSLTCDWFCWCGDVHIQGNAEIKHRMIVIGDIRIDGDLTVNEVICIGDLNVEGTVRVVDMLIGGAVSSSQSIEGVTLRAGFDPYYVARIIERIDYSGNGQNSLTIIKERARTDYEPNPEFPLITSSIAVRAGVNLTCVRLETGGAVELGATLTAGRVFIDGYLHANDIDVKERLAVDGWIDYRGVLQSPELPDRPIARNGDVISAPSWYGA